MCWSRFFSISFFLHCWPLLLCFSSFLTLLPKTCDALTTTYIRLPSIHHYHHQHHQQQRQQKFALDATKHNQQICILGGGFGGLNAALTLSSLPFPPDEKPSITLIDTQDRFVFLPLLYELCVGDANLNEVAPTFSSLLQNTGIEFRQGTVEGIDVEKNVVYLTQSSCSSPSSSSSALSTVHYDSLIIATGSNVNLEALSGAASRALPFYTLQDCFELRKILTFLDSIPTQEFQREINVVIVGGGYSGVELALNLNERLKPVGKGVNVTLVHRGKQILEYALEYNQETAVDKLQKSGIHVMTSTTLFKVMDPDFTKDHLLMEDDDGDDAAVTNSWNHSAQVVVAQQGSNEQIMLNADILIWTAGAMSTNVQKGILNSKLPRDSYGRIITTKYLNVKGHDNVFALGDCSRVMGKHRYPATAAVAMQQAPFVAWNVYSSIMTHKSISSGSSSIEKTKPVPFSLVNLGEMMTLGGQDATISSMDLVKLNGPAASILRRLIYALRMPTGQQALVAALSSSAKKIESLLDKKRLTKK